MVNVVLVDQLSGGISHLEFNFSTLALIGKVFRSNRIEFYGEASHCLHLSKRFEHDPMGDRLVFKPIKLLRKRSTFLSRIRNMYQAWALARQIGMRGEISLLMFLGFRSETYKAIRRAAIRWPKLNVLMLAHRSLEEVDQYKSRDILRRLLDMDTCLSDAVPLNFAVLVLEHAIKSKLVSRFPHLARRSATFVFPMPRVRNERPGRSVEVKDFKQNLKVAFLGNAIASKGFDEFYEASLVNRGSKFSWRLIGRLTPEVASRNYEHFELVPDQSYLPDERYKELLGESDLVCLPLGDEYEWAASGTLLDAIAFRKPLVTRKVGSVKDLFKRHGALGYLLDDGEGLSDFFAKFSPSQFLEALPAFEAAADDVMRSRSDSQLELLFKSNLISLFPRLHASIGGQPNE